MIASVQPLSQTQIEQLKADFVIMRRADKTRGKPGPGYYKNERLALAFVEAQLWKPMGYRSICAMVSDALGCSRPEAFARLASARVRRALPTAVLGTNAVKTMGLLCTGRTRNEYEPLIREAWTRANRAAVLEPKRRPSGPGRRPYNPVSADLMRRVVADIVREVESAR